MGILDKVKDLGSFRKEWQQKNQHSDLIRELKSLESSLGKYVVNSVLVSALEELKSLRDDTQFNHYSPLKRNEEGVVRKQNVQSLIMDEKRDREDGKGSQCFEKDLTDSRNDFRWKGIAKNEQSPSSHVFHVVPTPGIKGKRLIEGKVGDKGNRGVLSASENYVADGRKEHNNLIATKMGGDIPVETSPVDILANTKETQLIRKVNESEWLVFRLTGSGSKHSALTPLNKEKLQNDKNLIRELPEIYESSSENKKLPSWRMELKKGDYRGLLDITLEPRLESMVTECVGVLHGTQEHKGGFENIHLAAGAGDKKRCLHKIADMWKKFRNSLSKHSQYSEEKERFQNLFQGSDFRVITNEPPKYTGNNYIIRVSQSVSSPFVGPKENTFTRGTSIDDVFLESLDYSLRNSKLNYHAAAAQGHPATEQRQPELTDPQMKSVDEYGYIIHEIHPEYFTEEGFQVRRSPMNAEDVGKYYPAVENVPQEPRKSSEYGSLLSRKSITAKNSVDRGKKSLLSSYVKLSERNLSTHELGSNSPVGKSVSKKRKNKSDDINTSNLSLLSSSNTSTEESNVDPKESSRDSLINHPGTPTEERVLNNINQFMDQNYRNGLYEPFYVGAPPNVYMCQQLTEEQYRELHRNPALHSSSTKVSWDPKTQEKSKKNKKTVTFSGKKLLKYSQK